LDFSFFGAGHVTSVAPADFPFRGEILISVPQFLQGDPRWRDDPLGDTPGTLGGEGCAIASASMLLGHYGMAVDPKHLNRFLREHNGFEGQGWLRWESAAEFAPGLIEKAYEDLPSFLRIDWNLLLGNPVIVRIRRPDGITHFVVIVGKRGLDYLIRDPAGSGGGRVLPVPGTGGPDRGAALSSAAAFGRIPNKQQGYETDQGHRGKIEADRSESVTQGKCGWRHKG